MTAGDYCISLSASDLAEEVAATTQISSVAAGKVVEAYVKFLIDNALGSTGQGFTAPGLGEFSFKAHEQLGPAINMRTGTRKKGNYPILIYVRTLIFHPTKRLKHTLDEHGLSLRFTPVSKLNSKKRIGELPRQTKTNT